ncbi:hypothetical protein D9V41_09100 [Aeromicrobium phragmitis]|uniref:Uncharacterized protein n=1 Tax=Aeromicrobium phragmitis TaxID=2478914 RepID=A0A3L8PKX0_9ACTN|nr:hypothetical protein [Aeromicrobium phragmitis]RLV56035.1 hypothetical protein D9V41_09100 [Aeromicrobium phragmitis]
MATDNTATIVDLRARLEQLEAELTDAQHQVAKVSYQRCAECCGRMVQFAGHDQVTGWTCLQPGCVNYDVPAVAS